MDYNISTKKVKNKKGDTWKYFIDYKINGKWKQTAKQGFKLQSDAKTAAYERIKTLEAEITIHERIPAEYKDITLGQFIDVLLEHEKMYKENGTIVSYQWAARVLAPVFDLPIADITHMNIQRCIDKKCYGGTFKTSTLKLYVSRIQYFFNQACSTYGIIIRNPINKILLPKNESEEKAALSDAESKSLLAALKKRNDAYYYIALIALTCGLRAGEISGLTWGDIDFSCNTITVNKQWKKTSSGYGFGKVKSKNSNRVVPMPYSTAKELAVYKRQSVTDIHNRLFISDRMNNNYHQLAKRMGICSSLHILRHTYATRLVASGMDFKTAAKILGHDVLMTMRVYSHVTDDMMDTASKKINNMF